MRARKRDGGQRQGMKAASQDKICIVSKTLAWQMNKINVESQILKAQRRMRAKIAKILLWSFRLHEKRINNLHSINYMTKVKHISNRPLRCSVCLISGNE